MAHPVRWPGQATPSRVSLAYCMPFGWARTWYSDRWELKFDTLAKQGDWLALYAVGTYTNAPFSCDLDRLFDWEIERTPVESLAHGAIFHYAGQPLRARELWSRSPQHPLSQYALFETEMWGEDSDDDDREECLATLMNTNPYVLFDRSWGDAHMRDFEPRPGEALSDVHRVFNTARAATHFSRSPSHSERCTDMFIEAIRGAERMGDPALDPDNIIMTMHTLQPWTRRRRDVFERVVEVSPESDCVRRQRLLKPEWAAVTGSAEE